MPSVWKLIAEDYHAQVNVVLWMRTWNREFDLSGFSLRELARRQLPIHVDVYVETDQGK
jgi:hypothetical protein